MKYAAYDGSVIRGVGATKEDAEANSTHVECTILPLSDGMQAHLLSGKEPNAIDHIEHGGVLMTYSEYETTTEI